jgi:hypothetical protein
MPAVNCPCCRASNEVAPNCRRCSADLSLLFQLETEREALLATAGFALRNGRAADVLATIATVESIRPGSDVNRIKALAHLVAGDYPQAYAAHRTVARQS